MFDVQLMTDLKRAMVFYFYLQEAR